MIFNSMHDLFNHDSKPYTQIGGQNMHQSEADKSLVLPNNQLE